MRSEQTEESMYDYFERLQIGIGCVVAKCNYDYASIKLSSKCIDGIKRLNQCQVDEIFNSCKVCVDRERQLKKILSAQHELQFKKLSKDLKIMIEDPEVSVWNVLWKLFDNEKLDGGVFSLPTYLEWFARLWLADPFKFMAAALIMLHHAKGHKNTVLGEEVWAAALVTMLLLLIRYGSSVKNWLCESGTNGHVKNVYKIYKFHEEIENNPLLLDSFYMRFNGGRYDHVRGCFGFEFNADMYVVDVCL